MPTVAERRAAQERIADQAAPVLQAVVADAMGAAAETYAALGQVRVPDDHHQRVTDALMQVWGGAARQSGRALIDEFKADFPLDSKSESFFDLVVARFVEMFGARKVTRIVETTAEQVRDIILRAQRQGQGVDGAAQAIRDAIPGASRTRAHIIARTEAHGAANFAAQETAKTSRRPLMKEWVSVEDPRTRDMGEGDGEIDQFSHRAMNGVRVAMDEPYHVPTWLGVTEPLMFPGDPSGSPGNVINCRCAEIYVRPE